ncbi:hypothetical protein ACFLXZ_00355 [Chloroflexota bacterium]
MSPLPVTSFYIDIADIPADILVTLYLPNTDILAHYYRYLTLKIGVYAQTGEDL